MPKISIIEVLESSLIALKIAAQIKFKIKKNSTLRKSTSSKKNEEVSVKNKPSISIRLINQTSILNHFIVLIKNQLIHNI